MKLKDLLNEGRPMPMDTPNEFAYLDYKKWAYKYRAQYKKDILKIGDDVSKIFNAACSWWLAWANKNNKEFTFIKNRQKFGRALVIMMKDDDIVFSKAAWKKNNKITNIKEAYQKDGHKYNTEEVGETSGTDRGGIEMDNAFVGKDGILGVNNVFISWSEIKRLQKKYGR